MSIPRLLIIIQGDLEVMGGYGHNVTFQLVQLQHSSLLAISSRSNCLRAVMSIVEATITDNVR